MIRRVSVVLSLCSWYHEIEWKKLLRRKWNEENSHLYQPGPRLYQNVILLSDYKIDKHSRQYHLKEKKKNCTARETVKFNLRQLPWNKREGFQWRFPDAVERLTTAVNIASITIIYICCNPDTDLLRSDLFNTCSWFSAVCRFFNCAMFTRFRWLVQSKQRSTESCSKDRSVWKIDR